MKVYLQTGKGKKKKILLLFKNFLAHIIGKGIQLERF